MANIKSQKKKYKVKKGNRTIKKDSDAQIIGERIEFLLDKFGGRINPDIFWQDAKDPKSPTHSYFEWNIKKAAIEQWRQTARDLISAVADVTLLDRKQIEVRSFYNVEDNGQKYYVSRAAVMENTNYRIQLVNKLISILENASLLLRLLRKEL